MPPGTLVLMYHHVAEASSDAGGLTVSPGHFAEHLEVLRSEAWPVRLDELGSKPHRYDSRRVAVTFDDGYADNFVHAKPLLERFGVPATVMVAGGPDNRSAEFWWDELERILLQPGTLPESLDVPLDWGPHRVHLGTATRYSERQHDAWRRWRAWEDPPTERHALFTELSRALVSMSATRQQEVMSTLRGWSGTTRPATCLRALSADELIALSESPLVEIGAHTLTHPKLTGLGRTDQAAEIGRNKTYLEEVLNRPVRSFAYPFGDFSADTVAVVRDTGFARACSTALAPTRPSDDPFRIARLQVCDWDGDAFARWLRETAVASDERTGDR